MAVLSFNNANDSVTADDVRIVSSAVRFVEASRPEQKGNAIIYLVGQGDVGIPVVESLAEVLQSIGGLAAVARHYFAGGTGGAASMVYIAVNNLSHLRANKKAKPAFWHAYFVDGYELRIQDPLPAACGAAASR